ncbi:hypothetical protein ACIA78_27385 [Streptomyces xanthochromogenes]|uniref:hypothetical protein n=1 Tax=Streptomyces xanthochromogenes TaxID=67384 RepID=UPI0037A11C3F
MAPKSIVRYEWERELWNCPEIPGKYKHVLAALSFHATFDTGRDARPGNPLLAENAGVSEKTAYRALKYGREEGWVWRAEHPCKQGEADSYWLTLPRHDHSHELKAVKQRAGGLAVTPPREFHQGNSTKGVSPREAHQEPTTQGAAKANKPESSAWAPTPPAMPTMTARETTDAGYIPALKDHMRCSEPCAHTRLMVSDGGPDHTGGVFCVVQAA